jgi:hypothetical protein
LYIILVVIPDKRTHFRLWCLWLVLFAFFLI